MKTLKTLGKIKWEKIKIGEVFANNGCWAIFEKIDENKARLLADTWDIYQFSKIGMIFEKIPKIRCDEGVLESNTGIQDYNINKSYKLPLNVQRLWKEE